MDINPKLSNHHPDSIISVKCSCIHCDSDSCFAKRSKNHCCVFQMCDDRKTYRPENDCSKIKKKCCDDINAIYLNATKPNINTELEELTDDEINYESERKTLIEINQPLPSSLDEYLDHLLCVDKASSKFKQKAPSLSGYIEIISENAEYKRKLNLFNDYVQSLKHGKYSKGCDDVTCFTAIQNSLRTQQWYNTLSEISGQPKTTTPATKHESRTLYRCLDKEESSTDPATQIQKTTTKPNTVEPNVLCENCNDSYKTTAPKDSSFFKYNILKKLKDACLACSCKVCECIAPKSITNDICKCKPCQCAECTGYATAQAMLRGPLLSPTLTCSCSAFNDQSAQQEQDKCSCAPGDCEMSNMKNLAKCGDVPKSPLAPLASVSRITCICLPCNCSECLQNNTATDEKYKYVESNVTICNQSKGIISEIYRNNNNKNKNNKENFVALCTGMPRFNMNRDYETKRSKTCICKECECITCICKENTINALKSSELFSTIDENTHLLKSNCGNNNNYGKSSYRLCESCSRKRDLLHHSADKWDKQTSGYAFDQCVHLSDEPINPKSHLNRCRCTNCRCERCIAHRFVSNYSSTVGVGPIKKGDVLSPLAHQTKLQNLKLEEKATPTPLYNEDELRYRDENLNVNSHKENMNYHGTFKNLCPKDISSQPSVSRQANRDMGTMLSKSFNRLNILQCDAYVHSQAFNLPKPVLRNSFTSSRSRSSIYSITGRPSQVHKNHSPGSENTMKSLKRSYHRSSYDNSKLGVKNKVSEKREEITLSKVNENEITNSPYFNGQVLKDVVGKYKTNNCALRRANNIFTEMTPTNQGNKSENKVCCSHGQAKLKKRNDIDNQPTKCLSTSAITTLEKLIAFSSEQIKNKSCNGGNNFNCFRMLHDLTKASLIGNINNYNSPKVKLRDWSTNHKLLAIKKENEKARQTIENAKKFSLHLLSLLEMYEKANNEFVKTSDELKTAYRSILDRKLSHNEVKNIKAIEKYNVTTDSKSELSLEEHATPTLNINMVSTYEPVFLEDIIAKRLSYCRTASKQPELNYMNGLTSNIDFGLLETVSDDVGREEGLHKNCERICYAKVQNGRGKRNSKHKINPEYDKQSLNTSKILTEITRYADLKPDEFESLIKSVKHEQSMFNSTDTTKQYVYGPKRKEEEVETDGSVCKKSFGLTAKPNIISEGAGISEVASLQVDTKGTMLSISVHSNTTNTIKIEKTSVNKALNQLQLEVRKLLELAILEPLNSSNVVDDSEDSFLESPSLFDESLLNFKIKELSKENKAINEQPEQADKEVWCSDPNLLGDFKRQIREQLKIACMHPLMNKQSSLFSYSCNSECDDLKARFLVVRKISEHTALIEWSQPLGLDVKGYELLVDGKTVQLIMNPSKCMTAVTCLPHAEKILLTIRTITFVMPEVGHYPTTTTIYRPHQQ